LKLGDIHGGHLMIGDMGCIYVSIDKNDRLHATDSCY
jgi:hypothetical protein